MCLVYRPGHRPDRRVIQVGQIGREKVAVAQSADGGRVIWIEAEAPRERRDGGLESLCVGQHGYAGPGCREDPQEAAARMVPTATPDLCAPDCACRRLLIDPSAMLRADIAERFEGEQIAAG